MQVNDLKIGTGIETTEPNIVLMKTLFTLTLSFLLSTQLFSQTSGLLINENFAGLTNGNLTTANGGWTSPSGAGYVQVANTTPLLYTDYNSGAEYVTLNNATFQDDPYKAFLSSQTVATTANNVVYMSFVVRVAAAANTVTANSNTRSVLSLSNSGSNASIHFFIGNNGSGANNLKFGIGKSSNTNATFASANYNFATTYLIVIKYVYVSGSNNDQMYLFVNPVISSSAPATSGAAASITTGTDVSNTMNSVLLTQNASGSAAAIDAIKVAYAKTANSSTVTANDAAAWMALAPYNGSLPVTFGTVNATAKGKAVQIDWTSYTESNVKQYEVERSEDAQHFTSVANVTAKNATGVNAYSVTDVTARGSVNFYRIKSVDMDGKVAYSAVVKAVIENATAAADLTVYPNPVKGSQVAVQVANLASGNYSVQLYSANGQQVYNQSMVYSGGRSSQSVQLPSGTKAGVYYLVVSGNNVKMTRSLVIE